MDVSDDELYDAIGAWYTKSQPDYTQLYINLYIAYAMWFGRVTRTEQDAEAIVCLKKRRAIWDEYLRGQTMTAMQGIIERVYDHVTAIRTNDLTLDDINISKIVMTSSQDWKGLIDYWYAVRCDIFHGNHISRSPNGQKTIELAYRSLSIYMAEIVKRMERYFTDHDMDQMRLFEELAEARYIHMNLCKPDSAAYVNAQNAYHTAQRMHRKLYQKYLIARDPWAVDIRSGRAST